MTSATIPDLMDTQKQRFRQNHYDLTLQGAEVGVADLSSYLDHIAANGVQCVEIANSGHFPTDSNPPAMWAAIAETVAAAGSS